MNERDIFIAALEKATPQERSEFVRVACGGDSLLRQSVEALLQTHERTSDFLQIPLVERLAEGVAALEDAESPNDPAERKSSEALGFLSPSDQPGSLGRLGHYEVQEVIGSGGMGIVLRAFDQRLHRVVAIKVMAGQLATNAAARKRFLREARAAAAVCHDHIVTIHAVEEALHPSPFGRGAGGEGLPYLVMQYVSGMSLQQRIDRDGPLAVHQILRIGMQTAAGLAAAHAQGLIHRDIKPANILLENGVERVKITDFGLARVAADASISQTGIIAGTPKYMSPEQARGEALDCRTDLFSLGSVLYAMCTGRAPFRAANSMAVLKRVCEDAPSPIREANSEIPDWLVALIDKLQSKSPLDRYQSAAEVAEILGQRLAQLQHSAPLPTLATPTLATARPAASRWRMWTVAAAILLCLATTFGLAEGTGVSNIASTVIRLLTPEGTLIVEINDPAVKVTVEGDGGLVITGAGLHEVRLKPGSYKLQAVKNGQPVPLERELVSMAQGGREVVRVKLETPPATAIAPGERGAFVLLGGKGVAERNFDALAEAVQSAYDGDTIEIRGNGPFITEPIQLGRKALTIRAGAGFRPVIKLGPEWAEQNVHLLHTQAALVLEGLELHRVRSGWDEKSYHHIVESERSPLMAVNCRFVLLRGRFAVHTVDSPVVDLRNCEFLLGTGGKLAPGNKAVAWRAPAAGRCRIQNCLTTECSLRLYSESFPPKPASVVLAGNTLVAREAPVLLFLDPASEPPVGGAAGGFSVEASTNVLDSGNVILHSYYIYPGDPPPTDAEFVRRSLNWKGDRNLFSLGPAFIAWVYPGTSEFGIKDLAEWKRFWQQDDSGCTSGKVRFRGGDIVSRADKAPEQLTPEDFRLRPDSPGYRAGEDGKDLGADIDLVGPGPAYERWKKTPEYQQWLKDTGQVKNAKRTELTPEEVRERQSAEALLRKGVSVFLLSADFKAVHALEKPGQPWPAGSWHVHVVWAVHLPTLTPADLTALRDFPRLRGFDLIGSPVTTAAILDQIEGRELTELRLNGVPTTSKDVARLAKIKTLSTLFLHDTGLSDDDIAQLARLPLLNDVNVGGNQLTDEALKHLAQLPLKRLFISRTKVTDAGLAVLHSCKTLAVLNVVRTDVTADGVAKLQVALPKCEVVWGKDAGKGK